LTTRPSLEKYYFSQNCVPVVPPGSCLASGSLSILVSGPNAVAYVPKGNWAGLGGASPGITVANVEGSSITPTVVATAPDLINSCASNPTTLETLCTANNADYYSLKATTISGPLTSNGAGAIGFSGGNCTNCGVAMDATDNLALIGLSVAPPPAAGAPEFELLNLNTATTSFTDASPSGRISEDPLIDPIRHLLLSASENNNYEPVDISNLTKPVFYENPISGVTVELDSSAEDCATGIALAPAEGSSPSQVFLADLTQAKFSTPVGTRHRHLDRRHRAGSPEPCGVVPGGGSQR
jgi:hypothetical protein